MPTIINSPLFRGLAQMARVLGLGPRGREFESHIPEFNLDIGWFSWLGRPDKIGKVGRVHLCPPFERKLHTKD